jgi:hypothetical protein
MPTEIQEPSTGNFLPLVGVFNFGVERKTKDLTLFHFHIDRTREGEGQAILRESLRTDKLICVRNSGRIYTDNIMMDADINTSDGTIMAELL